MKDEKELVSTECGTKVTLQVATPARLLLELGIVNLNCAANSMLGGIQGLVGTFQKCFRISPVGGCKGNSNAFASADLDVF